MLELTYTAHDMAPFARDMGYVDETDQVKPPFPWNEEAPSSPTLQARRRVIPPLRGR